MAWAGHPHPSAAAMNSTATSASRARMAAYSGSSPPVPAARGGWSTAVIGSGGPGELRFRQPGLALVSDAEGIDPSPFGLSHRQVRAHRMEHPVEADRLAGLDPERHDVLDLEVDRVADLHPVGQPVVAELDGRTLHAANLADQRRKGAHRPAELTAEHLDQTVELRVARPIVDVDAELPVALGHHLRRIRDQHHLPPADVGALDVTLLDVERQGHPAVVIGGAMVEGQVARAHQLARTGFDVTALQAPRHGGLPDRAQYPPRKGNRSMTSWRAAGGQQRPTSPPPDAN